MDFEQSISQQLQQEQQEEQEIFVEQAVQEERQKSASWEIVNPIKEVNINPQIDQTIARHLQKGFQNCERVHMLCNDAIKYFYSNDQILLKITLLIKRIQTYKLLLTQIEQILSDQNVDKTLIENNIEVSKQDMNTIMLDKLFEVINNQIFNDIINNGSNMFYQSNLKCNYRALVVAMAKLDQCIILIPYAAKTSKNDLFCFDLDSPQWRSIKNYERKILGSKEAILKSYNDVTQGIVIANAFISKGSEQQNSVTQGLMEGFGALYYAIAQDRARKRAEHFLAEPNQSTIFKAWNLMETGFAKQMIRFAFPSITYNKKIYIPRLFKSITHDGLMQQYQNGSINRINNDVGQHVQYDIPTFESLFKDKNQRICVRILCNRELIQINKKPDFVQSIIGQQISKFEKIIIHIHGGGFVSMSSRSHQTYTRQWVKIIQCPLFSIDYRKAPEDPYPAGIDDVWQAYMFILNYIEKYFYIQPKRIILVGDSAGGNLCAALTIQAIKSGVRVPDGQLLIYPALNLSLKSFTPSMLVALNDRRIVFQNNIVLHHTVLKMCVLSYVSNKDYNADQDPLISPSKASDEILKKFPQTAFMIGTNDPLHDESWRLFKKLQELEIPTKMIVYDNMPHGFLSFDVPQGMKESHQTVIDSANWLQEMLN